MKWKLKQKKIIGWNNRIGTKFFKIITLKSSFKNELKLRSFEK